MTEAEYQLLHSKPDEMIIRADHWLSEQLAKPEAPYLLKDLIMPGGLTVIAGRPKLGKSLLAMSACMAMSAGRPIGMLQPLGVSSTLYFDLEGVEQETAKRLEGMRTMLGWDAALLANIFIYKVRMLELMEAGFLHKVIDLVRAANVQTVVLDTFAASFSGDENAKRDVQRYLNALKEIRVATGCATILVHHVNKATFAYKQTAVMMDPDAGLRGSSALQGAYDSILALQDGWVDGKFITAMIVRGKYSGDWWCEFSIKKGREYMEQDKSITQLKLEFGARQDEYGLFETGPTPEAPAFRYPPRKDKG